MIGIPFLHTAINFTAKYFNISRNLILHCFWREITLISNHDKFHNIISLQKQRKTRFLEMFIILCNAAFIMCSNIDFSVECRAQPCPPLYYIIEHNNIQYLVLYYIILYHITKHSIKYSCLYIISVLSSLKALLSQHAYLSLIHIWRCRRRA